jgi:hypothetical protein
MDTILIFCSWCKKLLDIKDGEGVSGNSHGICKDCEERMRKEKYKVIYE